MQLFGLVNTLLAIDP